MLTRLIALALFAQFTVPMHTGALASAGSSCSMPSSGALAEYYASATGGGAPSSCTGAAITSWGDNSAGGHNLTAAGSPTCASDAGIGGKNAVNFPNGPYFTASSHIPCTTTCSVYIVINVTSLSTTSTLFADESTVALSYQIDSTSGVQELDQQFTAAIGTSTTALTAGVWKEIAVVYSGGTASFYLNGVADGSGSGAATISDGPDVIGANYSGGTFQGFTNAKIAEIYFSSVGTYQSAVHTCNVTRFGV